MDAEYEIVDITPQNVDDYDLLCKKSKKKEAGYQAKLSWFEKRYQEGLRLKILRVIERNKFTSRGVIEYVPSEYAWRVVNAPNYLIIHCLWIVGKWKKKGFGTELLQLCIDDAKKMNKAGVAMVASDATWVTGKKLLIKNGFELVDTAPPAFELVAMTLSGGSMPSFPTDWRERSRKCGDGLTVFHSGQCPYQFEVVEMMQSIEEESGVKVNIVELKTAKEVQKKSPTAYGVFGLVFNGELLSYKWMSKKELLAKIR